MGVTAITFVVNKTRKNVIINCLENPKHSGNNATIKGNDTAGPPDLNMWIPWATSAEDMKNKKYIKLTIESKNEVHYIYQEGGSVRYSNKTIWEPHAPAVPGYGSVDGNRTLVIESDGSWEFHRAS